MSNTTNESKEGRSDKKKDKKDRKESATSDHRGKDEKKDDKRDEKPKEERRDSEKEASIRDSDSGTGLPQRTLSVKDSKRRDRANNKENGATNTTNHSNEPVPENVPQHKSSTSSQREREKSTKSGSAAGSVSKRHHSDKSEKRERENSTPREHGSNERDRKAVPLALTDSKESRLSQALSDSIALLKDDSFATGPNGEVTDADMIRKFKEQVRLDRLRDLFEKVDTDGSGNIDQYELAALLKTSFKNGHLIFNEDNLLLYSQTKIAELSKTGSLNFQEFCYLYETIISDPDVPAELKDQAKKKEGQKAIKMVQKHRLEKNAIVYFDTSPEVIAIEKKIKKVEMEIDYYKRQKKEKEKEIQKREHKKKARTKMLQRLFAETDVDHSGTLDVDELHSLLSKTFQIAVNDSEPKEKSFLWTFAKEQIDLFTNNTGQASFDDFVKLYEKILDNPEVPDELKIAAQNAEEVQRRQLLEKEKQDQYLELAKTRTAVTDLQTFGAVKPDKLALDFSLISNPPLLFKAKTDQREKVALEFLTTEQFYTQGLMILVNDYLLGLKAVAAEKKDISEIEVNEIFMGIEEILSISDKLLAHLEERFYTWDEDGQDHLGDIFSYFAPQFEDPYCTYIAKYEEAMKKMQEKREKNSSWRKVMEEIDKRISATTNLKFPDYFIMPVQRVPRYNLLIRDLKAKTPEEHPDYAELTLAGDAMDKLAVSVNEYIRNAESLSHLKLIKERSGFEKIDIIPEPYYANRMWLKDGEILAIFDLDRNVKEKKHCDLMLFSDIIVASAFLSKKAEPCDYSIPSYIIWVHDRDAVHTKALQTNMVADDDLFKNSILLRGPKSNWLVGFKSVGDKNSWKSSIISNSQKYHQPSLEEPLVRKGKYDFATLGIYDGEWSDTWIHGKGTLIIPVPRPLEFRGLWHHKYRCGFGTTVIQGESKVCGWKFDQKEQKIEIWSDYDFWGNLTPEWDRIVGPGNVKSKERRFAKGETLIAENTALTSLFKVVSGTVRAERTAPGSSTVAPVTHFAQDELIGSECALSGTQKSRATVIAETDVVAHEIALKDLFFLLRSDPGLSAKFYHYLALLYKEKLSNLQKTNKEREEKGKPDEEADDSPPTPSTVTAHSTSTLCLYKQRKGLLVVDDTEVLFECTQFGSKTKIQIPLKSIDSVSVKKDELIINSDTHSSGKSKDIQTYKFSDLQEKDEIIKVLQPFIKEAGKDKKENDSKAKSKLTKDKAGESALFMVPSSAMKAVSSEPIAIEDWSLILNDSLVVSKLNFKDGEVILTEGTINHNIFSISMGCKVKIVKNTPEGPKILASMGQNELFGELSFLESRERRSVALASIVADGDVEVTRIDSNALNLLFVNYPALAGQFYCYIGDIVAQRFHSREDEQHKKHRKK